ncbi:MAG: biotin/lipoyl-containing protein [Bacillota bacterium]
MATTVNAHMPGLVARVLVNEGDQVTQGQTVVVINCMKNELQVVSANDGKVQNVLVKEWDEVEIGSPLIVLE